MVRRYSMIQAVALVVLTSSLVSCRWLSDYYAGNFDFRRQEYPYSILYHERFLERYKKPKKKREIAMIKLGQAYMKMRAFHDAQRVFSQYESEFPNGRFIGVAREALAEVRRIGQERDSTLAKSVAAAKEQLKAIRAKLDKGQTDPDLYISLGNAYWKLGQYKSAGEAYLKAITLKPELRSNPLLLERLIFDINGNLIPIENPAQRVALARERHPLVIENVHDYSSRGVDDFFAARRRFYVVTGRVRNQSTRPILGVRVQVTLYDSLQQILEVGMANIGTLYPQQSRPFVVKSGLDAEAMNNITRYECEPLYQQ